MGGPTTVGSAGYKLHSTLVLRGRIQVQVWTHVVQTCGKGALCFTVLGAPLSIVVFLLLDSKCSLLVCGIAMGVNLVFRSPAVTTC